MAESVFERVKRILKEDGIEDDQIKPNAHLKDDLGMDSLDQVVLMIALEEEFGGSISDAEAEGLQTIEQIVELIEGRLKE